MKILINPRKTKIQTKLSKNSQFKKPDVIQSNECFTPLKTYSIISSYKPTITKEQPGTQNTSPVLIFWWNIIWKFAKSSSYQWAMQQQKIHRSAHLSHLVLCSSHINKFEKQNEKSTASSSSNPKTKINLNLVRKSRGESQDKIS